MFTKNQLLRIRNQIRIIKIKIMQIEIKQLHNIINNQIQQAHQIQLHSQRKKLLHKLNHHKVKL